MTTATNDSCYGMGLSSRISRRHLRQPDLVGVLEIKKNVLDKLADWYTRPSADEPNRAKYQEWHIVGGIISLLTYQLVSMGVWQTLQPVSCPRCLTTDLCVSVYHRHSLPPRCPIVSLRSDTAPLLAGHQGNATTQVLWMPKMS